MCAAVAQSYFWEEFHMSVRFALISMLAGALLVNGLAITPTFAKDKEGKKDDKKSVATAPAYFQLAAEHKKKDDKKLELTAEHKKKDDKKTQLAAAKKKKDDKKQELIAACNHEPPLMKPATWRHYQQTHRSHRSFRNA
jgi:CRISPR/Cas system CMR-associated protein Cmr5 small subunit